jgi:hypothetical protein
VTTDEGFREIQLNGKQLVFLFMAATVVSVVIFLCGVLVGRGVRAEPRGAADVASTAVVPDPVPAPSGQASPVPSQPPAEPPAPADELSYFDRLQKKRYTSRDAQIVIRRVEPDQHYCASSHLCRHYHA